MTPEAKIKIWVDNWMTKRYPKAFKYSPPGVGIFGKNGMPDRMWFIHATDDCCVVVAIEVKAPNGRLTELQKRTLMRLRNLGVLVAKVEGKDETKMRRLAYEIDRRVQLANEKYGAPSI